MMTRMAGSALKRKGREWLGRYKYVLLMVAAGLVLLALPGEKERERTSAEQETQESFSVKEMEERLEETLSRIHGAGDVTVMLTVQGETRQVLAEDEQTILKADGTSQVERSVVTLNGGSGAGEKTVVLQRMNPIYQGAVVVCEGGENAKVKLKLMEAVMALTGLGADKITICKGKG